ncbi:hypothetical protein AX774_g3569 [Zancudomyces culisetae]|uniref:Uncharacterized protein n=1 Tax=Zancudomyces culisetae TaxID=1213189 RepID=A0A1R1PPL9_ZANCU|nr:hypothetical protein AX774_g3569 [Zancudomyces culisetae]|eukprot:OMH82936.1 hypothetical protein AX774_g3569 [Zancudomyces culisetae]
MPVLLPFPPLFPPALPPPIVPSVLPPPMCSTVDGTPISILLKAAGHSNLYIFANSLRSPISFPTIL